MKTILICAYAVNPYKGSEDGTGWNLLRQVAMRNRILLITRCNNQEPIEKYMAEHPEAWHARLTTHYFDLPYWARFWKRGARGALPYYMLWQMSLPAFVRRNQLEFDIAHQLNFHNDWLPTLLWRLGKPVVWGPVGHHPPVPRQFIRPVYGRKAWLGDQMRHRIKAAARFFNPWYRRSLDAVSHILTINRSGQLELGFPEEKTTTLPAVGAELNAEAQTDKAAFTILSVGRFVPLKGFDVTIRSFAAFVGQLPEEKRKAVKLCLVGKGPESARLQALAASHPCADQIEFIEWMPRTELMKLYQQADLFLFPSHEGAGMVVPEALSFGLPVVCFDNAGPGELISEACGVRIPYGNYADSVLAFANAMEAIYGNAHLQRQMSEAARLRAREVLSWSAKGEAIQQVYNSISGS